MHCQLKYTCCTIFLRILFHPRAVHVLLRPCLKRRITILILRTRLDPRYSPDLLSPLSESLRLLNPSLPLPQLPIVPLFSSFPLTCLFSLPAPLTLPTPYLPPGGSSGDLRMSLPLKTTHWSRLAPWWAAAGLSCLQDIPTTHEAASHPASVRYTMSEITRTALAGF